MTGFDQFQETLSQQFARRDRFRNKRMGQRNILPSGVKARSLSGFIFKSSSALNSAATVNGSSFNVNFFLTQNSKYEVFAINYVALFVGSVTTANQIYPVVGSSQDITQWQITGGYYDWAKWNINSYVDYSEYVGINVENISAGSVTVYIYNKWKYISPRESA